MLRWGEGPPHVLPSQRPSEKRPTNLTSGRQYILEKEFWLEADKGLDITAASKQERKIYISAYDLP